MKKILVFLFLISFASISEAKKKEILAYEQVPNPVVVENSDRLPIVFQTVINSKIKGDNLYDAIYKWSLLKSQITSKYNTGLAVLGVPEQKIKRGEIITENKRMGIINFVYVSSFPIASTQLFFTVLIEIKDDRFRVTMYNTKIFNLSTGVEHIMDKKTTAMFNKYYEVYVKDYKNFIYDLQKIANEEYKDSSDF